MIVDAKFKLKHFGEGEWVNEPDEFSFEYLGVKCNVKRIIIREPCEEEVYFGGHFCGYVEIPYNHPYHHKKYEDMDIECHGSLTYGEVHVGHWIGFDCAHAGDIVPSMKKLREGYSKRIFPIPEEFKDCALFNPVYRNLEFCIQQCQSIVTQLMEKK